MTTHPLVVKAVAEWLREQGIEDITLAESSGGPYTPEHMKRIYHVCGMDAIGDSIWLNEDCSAETVNCKEGFANHSFHLITPIVKVTRKGEEQEFYTMRDFEQWMASHPDHAQWRVKCAREA